jgi:hypothetical protein
MLKKMLVIALAVPLGLAVAGCGVRVENDGHTTTETRPVHAFQRLELDGSAQVVVRRGPSRRLVITGGSHRIDDVITRVQAGRLLIEPRDSVATVHIPDRPVTVIVSTPSLTGAAVHGSGTITADDLVGGDLETEVDGSGTIRASGRVDELAGSLDGSGALALGDLTARSATVDLAGSGDVHVAPRRTLTATVKGSGRVSYAGHPHVTRSVSGSGRVRAT